MGRTNAALVIGLLRLRRPGESGRAGAADGRRGLKVNGTRRWIAHVLASALLWPLARADADSRIAFTSPRDGNPEIYLVDPDGGRPTRLTDQTGEDAQPTWSGDGTRIAYVSDREGNRDIWRMSADGSSRCG